MAHILTGLFENKSDYKKLESDLENAGFTDAQYIVYLTENHTDAQYMASVEIADIEKEDMVKNIFANNFGVKTYFFNNMGIDQASYLQIKKLIEARSKVEIHNSPEIKHKIPHEGIDSELKY